MIDILFEAIYKASILFLLFFVAPMPVFVLITDILARGGASGGDVQITINQEGGQ